MNLSVDDAAMINLKLGWEMTLPKASQVNIAVYGRDGVARNTDFEGAKSDGYGRVLSEFLGAVEGGPQPDLSLVDDTMNIVAALYQSSRHDGERVDGAFWPNR